MEIIKKSDVVKNFNINEKNDFIKKYVDEKMSIQKISNIYGCRRGIIDKKLKEYNIPIRPKGSFLVDENDEFLKFKISSFEYENIKAKNKGHKNPSEYQKHLIEEKRKNNISPENCKWTRDELEDLYAYDKQNLSAVQIGKIHNPSVCSVTIGRWINIYDIEKKTSFEIQGGENSHRWQGGISFEPYCEKFNDNVKEYEREHWYRRCVLCNKTEEEDGRKMSVHHVDYNKNQGCDLIEWKLIPLCRSCNTIVNGDRDYYEKYFTNIINVREILEEFEWKIDYKSIGMVDEIKYKKIDKLKYKIKTIYNDFKYDWKSLGI